MKTILLVDDSATILMSMTAILTKAGYTVNQAHDGAEALTQMQATAKVDLMITDLNMPGMDGITLVRETRKLKQGRFLPILMLTTETQQTKRTEAKTAGATGWLTKPVTATDLLQVLTQVLPG